MSFFWVDFSRKRQQKKVPVARTKGTAGKGFVPSKKSTRVKKGDTLTSVVSEVSGGDKKQTVDVNVGFLSCLDLPYVYFI